jgi:NADPH-dependent 2,4-dienoyl-CoA reductase/sulfur reductase-like enzyme
MERIVVVGASLAGLRACETLRTQGFAGTITLIGAEAEVPYDRPPLSKKYLAGEWEPDRIRLRKPEAFAELNLDLRLGTRATALDLAGRQIHTDAADQPTVEFDAAIIATGASPRRLPNQPEWPGFHELRTMADADSLRWQLTEGARVVVVGAGFIGLEVAATARQRGCVVTVLEGAPAPLIRGLGSAMGAAVGSVHARHGVDVRCGVQITGFEGATDTGVAGVRLADGSVVPADVVVVGIGVTPSTDWLSGSGLQVRDGIVCDASLRADTTAPVWAAGDCARWPNALFGPSDQPEEMRVEHWTNAAEQGAHAANSLMADHRGEASTPYAAVPFFWSDQFDSRIQYVGRAGGGPDGPDGDDVQVIAGDPASGAFAALYGYRGRLRGALGVSMPKLVMPFRALLAARATWDEALAHAAKLTAG